MLKKDPTLQWNMFNGNTSIFNWKTANLAMEATAIINLEEKPFPKTNLFTIKADNFVS